MRPALFVVCFTLGVSLMVFSGYLPQSANASGGSSDVTRSSDNPAERRVVTFVPVFRARTPWPSPSAVEPEPELEPVEEPDWADEIDSAEVPADTPAGGADPVDDATPAEDFVAEGLVTEDPVAAGAVAEDMDAIPDPPVPDVPADEPDDWVLPETTADDFDAGAEAPPPVAYAGRGAVVWSGWNDLRLDGSGSAGENLAYEWRQIAGSAALTILDKYAAATSAVGLPQGDELGWGEAIYGFELTVTDEYGELSFDTVEFVVKAAPDITTVPAAERFFELRDGYLLGHLVAEAVNLEADRTTFEIVSPTALTLTKVGGDEYVLVEGVSDYAYVYQVTLPWQSGVSETWVEFLVDTDEKIPGIVQLAVSWE